MSRWSEEKKTVLDAAQEMARQSLVVGTSGNVSMRLHDSNGAELLAITPTSCYYDTLEFSDILITDFEGKTLEGDLKPSIEIMLHLGIYKARRKVNAVIHTHPVFSSVLAITGTEIPPILDDQVTYLGGDIKLAEYALPGSPTLVQNVVNALGQKNAVILAHHGALTVGRDLREAYTNCEMLEKTARIYILAVSVGKIKDLPAEALELEQAYFNYLHGDS